MHRRRSRTPLHLKSSFWHVLLHRQTKMKTRSASLGVFGCNASAVRLDDRTHDGKTHSEAFLLCGEELLEKPLKRCFGNAGAVVTHGDRDCAVPIVSSGNLHH